MAQSALAKLSSLNAVIGDLGVTQTPSVVVVDRNRKAVVLTGFVERNAINQAIQDARRNSIERRIKEPFVRQINETCANLFLRDGPPRTRRRTRAELKPALRRFEAIMASYAAGFASLKGPAKYRGVRSQVAERPAQGRELLGRAALGQLRPHRLDLHGAAGLRRRPQPQASRTWAPPPATPTAAGSTSTRRRLGGVDRERFAEHLSAPAGRGVPVAGGHDGAAGGAACGDLVRITLRVEGDRVAVAGFEASGCGALTAAASAAVTLVEGEPLLDAARVGAHAISEELGGLSPGKFHAADLVADALHGALGRAAHAQARARARPRPHAGRDERRGRLGGRRRCSRARARWRSRSSCGRDPENDAEASCCSAHAVRVARSVAHGMGMPHFTLDLREPFRAGVVDPFLAGYAAGVTPNPCVGCNGHVRLDAMVAFADRLGAATLATGHYARVTEDGLLRAAADPAKDQTYMLSAVTPETLARLRFPLGELTKPRVRELAAEAGLAVASKAESQDLCFLAGTGKAAFLARHAGLDDRPGEIVDRDGTVLARHRGAHHFTVGQRKGLGVAAPEPLYVLATDMPRRTASWPGRARRWPPRAVRLRGARLHRDAAEVDRVKLRYRSRAVPCRVAAEHGRGRVELELLEPVDGAAPGQTACLLRGDVDRGVGDDQRRVTRCHAATEAASASSPRAIIASSSSTAKRPTRRPCSVASRSCGPGSSPVASHTSTGWSVIP